ncbi:MAG TPA: N-acetylmuramoyl-L-alanine amidase [Opitutaceae bacterium]|nr:N-acetylmuramoyl-L-alanine amidase [Opitutaceae bacterium]
MPFPEISRLSPNRDEAPPHEQLGVLFHHSVSSFDDTIARMLDPSSKVSYHCLIGLDGSRCALVPDGQIAWHAGASSFRGRGRCNDFLLGVAFAGDTNHAPLTATQVASALEWLDQRWARRRWDAGWMTDHRQVSPGRKDDLHPQEWARLHAAIVKKFGWQSRVPPPAVDPRNEGRAAGFLSP